MIWALLFVALAVMLGGESPFMVKDLDKYVKHHVVDDTRKDKILDYLEEAKAVRKKTVKANNKLFKDFGKFEQSRDAKREDFEKIGSEMLELQKVSQNANINAIQSIQEYITEDEWKAIQVDIGKSFEKSKKKRNKAMAKLDKQFVKWVDRINKTISDEAKRKKAVAAVERLRSAFINNKKLVQDELLNQNSIIYKYKAPKEELKKIQEDYLDWGQEVFNVAMDTHFELVELTTPEEWRKIN
jgi:hypothetical protein